MLRRSQEARERAAALKAARREFRAAKSAWEAQERGGQVRVGAGLLKPETQALLDAARAEKWERVERARLEVAALEGAGTSTPRAHPLPSPPPVRAPSSTIPTTPNAAALFPGCNPHMVCPHCHTKGSVATSTAKIKQGISGGKATGALLTGGISLLATGLSRKQKMTHARCYTCGAEWSF